MKPSPLFLAAALVAGGCATSVHSKTSANADLSRYRTFAFSAPSMRPGSPPTVLDEKIRAALTRNFEARGLVPATSGQPDVLVAYHCRRSVVPDDSALEYDSDWGGVDPLATYEVGTLLVDLVDPQTHAIVWRGSAQRTIGENESLDHPDVPKLDQSVAKLIARYPVQVAAEPRTRF
jgi:hypothetical protein